MSEVLPSTPVKRPLDIWVITLWVALVIGLTPIGFVLFVHFVAPEGRELIPLTNLIFSLSVSGSALIAATAAWLGYPWARPVLIGLVVAHYGLLTLNNYLLITGGLVPENKLDKHWGRVIRYPISMIILVLYLTLNQRVKEFFKHYRQQPVQ